MPPIVGYSNVIKSVARKEEKLMPLFMCCVSDLGEDVPFGSMRRQRKRTSQEYFTQVQRNLSLVTLASAIALFLV